MDNALANSATGNRFTVILSPFYLKSSYYVVLPENLLTNSTTE